MLSQGAEEALCEQFREIDRISFIGTKKVMDAFSEFRVSESLFASSSGYGYDDRGRDVLDQIYARVFDAESAIVRSHIVNGTQALAIGLYGLLRPGDTLLTITGKPYDTLEEVIGIAGTPGNGSLADFGIQYKCVELGKDGGIDLVSVEKAFVPLIVSTNGMRPVFNDSVMQVATVECDVQKASCCYYMDDNSMVGARINKGDVVFIKSAESLENGDVGAFILNDKIIIRKYYFDGKNHILCPASTEFSPESFRGLKSSNVKIIGKVIAFQANL